MSYTIFTIGLRPANLRFSVDQITVTAYGHVGREFKLRPFSAGSNLTLRNKIEPLASTTSVERIWLCLVAEVEHMTRLLPQAVPYLSPASRALGNNDDVIQGWRPDASGLTPG